MKKLLSLPPNLVECFHDIMHADHKEWFCTSDPVGKKLGSGGGTAWLLNACREEEDKDAALGDWLAREKRILLHAGGQSRRLPGYAPSGKVLTPIPVFRWARGQKLTQDLLSLQLPLYEEIMERAPEGLRTLIASGDVYIRATQPLQEIPDVDVVCYGLWVDPELAKNHGVFVSSRKEPEKLDFMLQKPSVEEMAGLDAGLPVPDGHRYLAAERPRHRADGETFYRQGRGREVLRHVFGVRTGTGGASAHRG